MVLGYPLAESLTNVGIRKIRRGDVLQHVAG
jgi:hypothetical protein